MAREQAEKQGKTLRELDDARLVDGVAGERHIFMLCCIGMS